MQAAQSGVVVVDKAAAMTSHQVVAAVRRLAGTRKVGHAGTLDPMATGVLLVGVGKATRLLGYLAGTDKQYDATIRLGAATVTDDAEGEVVSTAVVPDLDVAALRTHLATFTGDIMQAPSAVSAIKVDGKRSYARVRAGEDVQLAERPVTVSRFDLVAMRRTSDFLDLDVEVECSTGTYIRALARDLGVRLGCGGHLTALRRTRVGQFGIDQARTLESLEQAYEIVGLTEVARCTFPWLQVTEAQAREIGYGRPLPDKDLAELTALFSTDDDFLALYEPHPEGGAKPRIVLNPNN